MTAIKIEKATGSGFCFGVRRAIDTLEKVAKDSGSVETLGAVVHNKQVLQRLAEQGIHVVHSVDEVQGDTLAIGAHGVSPEVEQSIRAHNFTVIDTTCRFVHRAQMVAKKLAEEDFFVIVFGDVNHPEVKGILAWAEGKGMATLDASAVSRLEPVPHRVGVLSQTTQIPVNFTSFVKGLVDIVYAKDAEIRIIDTICHDIRRRQTAALELASRVDLMLVVGDRTSANTNRLVEMCSAVTETHFIETPKIYRLTGSGVTSISA